MFKKLFGLSILKIGTYIILFCISLACGDFYSYSHDFSGNPNWTTNDPSWFHWNPALETYHLTIVSDGFAKWTYENIVWYGETFLFRFDIKITQDGYGSGIWFGVYSANMANYQDNHIVAHLGRDDGGHNIFLHTSANGVPISSGVNYGWLMNTWYRVVVYYDCLSNNAMMVVMNRSTGTIIASLSVNLTETLSSLVKIGASSVNISQYGNTFQAEIDNVGFANWDDWFLGVAETSNLNAGSESPLLVLKPNPAFGNMLIRFELPTSQKISLNIFDIQGRVVETLIKEETKSAGLHILHWQYKNSNIANGVYFVSLTADKGNAIRKLVTLK